MTRYDLCRVLGHMAGLKYVLPLMFIAAFNAQAAWAETCAPTVEGWAKTALERSLTSQLGLPDVPHPDWNPPTVEKIELGRKLFFDRRLSINNTMSCAMCHVPEQGFTNWELKTAIGVEGRSLKRNAPTVLNVGFQEVLFHDGRDFSLETQFISPLVAHNEMANPSAGHVVAQLNGLADYQPLFEAAFDAPASLDRIGMALGSYQRTLVAGNSGFDRWYFGNEEGALGDAQKRGFEVFTNKGNCASCHLIDEAAALFTDQLFHDTGYGWMREQIRQNPPLTTPVQVAPGLTFDVAFDTVRSVGDPPQADLGRYEVTEDPSDRWKLRTPTLRNVAVTPPYMHDGNFSTLRDVIAFYNNGGAPHATQDPRIQPLGLTPEEMDDLEAFLDSLTAPNLACLTAEARVLPPNNQ